MKTRIEAAQFASQQLHWRHACKLEKGNKVHYGKQELRELLDFIYGGEPSSPSECVEYLPYDWKPNRT